MSRKKQVKKPVNSVAVICIALILVAALLVFLGIQCITTVEYGLYSKNYSYYVDKAAECKALAADPTYGESYQLIAQDWEESAQNAGHYLTWHRAGAISLFIASALAIGGAAWLFIRDKQKKAAEAAAIASLPPRVTKPGPKKKKK